MNLGSGLGQINIAHSSNVLQANLAQKKSAVKVDSFQNQSYFSNSNKSSHAQNYATSVNSFYSPKQLLSAYSNPAYVKFLAETNPNIKNILNSKGLEFKVNPQNIANTTKAHITTTTAYALQIANAMGLSQADKQLLEQGAVFHDFGKILMPTEILNKPGMLNEKERDIMSLHADLGYELLSTTGMNPRVLNMVKNHHKPAAENTDVLGQILSVADIYSALREQRSYKQPMSQQEALALLNQKAESGEVSTEVVNALKSTLTPALTSVKVA